MKIRGYRIELGEIEAALTAHPGVADAVVVVREDAPGDKRLVAYLVRPTAHRRRRRPARAPAPPCCPSYMVPAAFVALDRLPLTANGKIDRARAAGARPAPWAAARPTSRRAPPRRGAVAAVWRRGARGASGSAWTTASSSSAATRSSPSPWWARCARAGFDLASRRLRAPDRRRAGRADHRPPGLGARPPHRRAVRADR